MTLYADDVLQDNETAGRVDIWLWLLPLILSGLGILMVTSTTSNFVYDVSGTPFTMGMRQLRSLGVGFVMMLVTFCIPMRFWYNISGAFWIASIIMLAATLIPGVGSSIGGASRWIRVGGISIQPSEIMILATVLESGKLFEKHRLDSLKCFRLIIILLIVSCLPLMLQPDLGSTIFLVMVCMGMFVERFGLTYPAMAVMFCGVGFLLLILFEPYRMRRISAFLDPYADPLDTGFQTIQGLIAFANGGAWGAGLGHGFQKLQYLPAAYTDFIYAAMGEELGLIGTLSVLALMTFWLFRCRALYNRVPDGYQAALVWGVALTIILPFFINIAGVTNMIPLTGIPLPFISYGGSALIMSWMRVGVLLRLQKDISRGVAV
ncbi:MAG: putative lipid II flippase FtsW [Synergistaceae bacterium]|jgi:cell division protein FtsW|nr:putative lipid II flippase FtsW [Synergistaceae bacterium]